MPLRAAGPQWLGGATPVQVNEREDPPARRVVPARLVVPGCGASTPSSGTFHALGLEPVRAQCSPRTWARMKLTDQAGAWNRPATGKGRGRGTPSNLAPSAWLGD